MPKSIDRNTQARIASELEKRSAQSRTPLTDGIDTTTRNAPTQYPFNVRQLKGKLLGWRGHERTIDVIVLAAEMNATGYEFPRGANPTETVGKYIGSTRVFGYRGLLGRKHKLTIERLSPTSYKASVD